MSWSWIEAKERIIFFFEGFPLIARENIKGKSINAQRFVVLGMNGDKVVL